MAQSARCPTTLPSRGGATRRICSIFGEYAAQYEFVDSVTEPLPSEHQRSCHRSFDISPSWFLGYRCFNVHFCECLRRSTAVHGVYLAHFLQ